MTSIEVCTSFGCECIGLAAAHLHCTGSMGSPLPRVRFRGRDQEACRELFVRNALRDPELGSILRNSALKIIEMRRLSDEEALSLVSGLFKVGPSNEPREISPPTTPDSFCEGVGEAPHFAKPQTFPSESIYLGVGNVRG